MKLVPAVLPALSLLVLAPCACTHGKASTTIADAAPQAGGDAAASEMDSSARDAGRSVPDAATTAGAGSDAEGSDRPPGIGAAADGGTAGTMLARVCGPLFRSPEGHVYAAAEGMLWLLDGDTRRPVLDISAAVANRCSPSPLFPTLPPSCPTVAAVDDGHAFFLDGYGIGVAQFGRGGGANWIATQMAPGPLTVSEGYLYFTVINDGGAFRAPVAGGALTKIAAASVAWTNGEVVAGDGRAFWGNMYSVLSVPVAGGTPSTVLTTSGMGRGPTVLGVGMGLVFWFDDQGLHTTGEDGRATSMLGPVPPFGSGGSFDGQTVYWVGGDNTGKGPEQILAIAPARPTRVLADLTADQRVVGRVVADAQNVYWTTNQILTCPSDTASAGFGPPCSVTLENGTCGGLWRAALSGAPRPHLDASATSGAKDAGTWGAADAASPPRRCTRHSDCAPDELCFTSSSCGAGLCQTTPSACYQWNHTQSPRDCQCAMLCRGTCIDQPAGCVLCTAQP
jgi:hypothetical protein